LIVALTLPAAVATAQDRDGYGRTGFYAGLGASIAFDEFAGIPNDTFQAAYGFQAVGGYRFHPHVAAELEIEWDPSGFKVSGAEIEPLVVTANAKAFLSTGMVQPFGLIGIGLMHVDATAGAFTVTATGFAARFGAGFDFYVNEHIIVTLDTSYVLPTGDVDGLNYVALGVAKLQYRF
jgi:opacity protein-like surface antigen